MPKTKDLQHLKLSQYKEADKLNARWDLYDYCEPSIDIHLHALKALQLTGNETVLDLGCTDGAVLRKLRENLSHSGRLIGLDINQTIFAEAQKKYRDMEFIEGTANNIPLPDKSVDVVTAFFVMYHAENIPKALQEISRVLKDNGKVVFSTASKNNFPKKRVFKDRAGEMLHVAPAPRFNGSFNWENAKEQIEAVFDLSGQFLYDGKIVLTDPKPYIAAIDSVCDMFEPVPKDPEWQKTMELFSREIQLEISQNGCYTDSVQRGYFICKKK